MPLYICAILGTTRLFPQRVVFFLSCCWNLWQKSEDKTRSVEYGRRTTTVGLPGAVQCNFECQVTYPLSLAVSCINDAKELPRKLNYLWGRKAIRDEHFHRTRPKSELLYKYIYCTQYLYGITSGKPRTALIGRNAI